MKKYIFGIISVALAVGFSAFTIPQKRANTTLTFVGDATNQTSVQTNGNYQDLGSTSCATPQDRICTITVDEANVVNGSLDPNVTITTSEQNGFYKPSAPEILSQAYKSN